MGVFYNDHVTVRHKETRVYLHSHLDRYPLRYDDGRISSQGQQVTGYPHNDTNNQWRIVPFKEFQFPDQEPIRNGDLVRFHHLITDSLLTLTRRGIPVVPH